MAPSNSALLVCLTVSCTNDPIPLLANDIGKMPILAGLSDLLDSDRPVAEILRELLTRCLDGAERSLADQ